jgi:HK97 gp10 family phage protein
VAFDVAFTGVSELKAGFAEIEKRLAEVTRAAVAEGAHFIEARAKQNAPVKTGTLRRSIRVFGPTSIGFGSYMALIGPTVIYGRRVELGFHGADSLGRHYDQEGRPYLGDAYAEAMAGPLSAIFTKHWSLAVS